MVSNGDVSNRVASTPTTRWRVAALVVVLGGLLLAPAAGPVGARPAAPPKANDPAFVQGLQWNLSMIGAPEAWSVGEGRGVIIGIIDSGIDTTHHDLAPNVLGTISCIGTRGDASLCAGPGYDDNGHGTHVAGIAAAVTDNGIGVASVAPEAKLLGVRVLTDRCEGTDCTARGDSTDVVAGIHWAVANGARVLNLSLGSDGATLDESALGAALRWAWAHGAIAVIASGNSGDQVLDLGDLPAIVVTGLDRDGHVASYANGVGSSRWALAAPGGEPGDDINTCRTGGQPKGVLSTYWNPTLGPDQYACQAGTSFAAPHVSGALAILLGLGFTPQDAVNRLLQSADPVIGATTDTVGAGRLDIARAVAMGPAPAHPTTTAPAAAAAAANQPPTPLTPAPAQVRHGNAHRSESRYELELAAALLILLVVLAQAATVDRRRQRSGEVR